VRQYPLGEGARSHLQSVTAAALTIADQLSKAGYSKAVLQRPRTDIKKPIEKIDWAMQPTPKVFARHGGQAERAG
jgi:hypothetical protein